MKKRIYTKTIQLFLSAVLLLSLSSCENFKRIFAGDLTDNGISMDSIALGTVFTPEREECVVSPSPYDTVFENCLFVGNCYMSDFFNSLSLWRRENPKLLEKSIPFYNTNFGIYENNYTPISSTSTHPSLNHGNESKKLTIEEAVRLSGAKRVVIGFSVVNDLPVYGDEENCHIKAAHDMGKLILSLKKAFGEIAVAVLSSPPISANAVQMKTINNEKIKAYNEELKKACITNGGDYIDTTELFSNVDNALKSEFSSNNYTGINESGCKVVLSALRYYAKERKGEI